MFISGLEVYKIKIGHSSSHTIGPMLAAPDYNKQIPNHYSQSNPKPNFQVICALKGFLAIAGKRLVTDSVIIMGVHGNSPLNVVNHNISNLLKIIIEEKWAHY